MKKEIQVKAHTRKTKSGKTVTVKAHTVSRESAEDMAKAALQSKKGSGKELQRAKKFGLNIDRVGKVKHPKYTKEQQDLDRKGLENTLKKNEKDSKTSSKKKPAKKVKHVDRKWIGKFSKHAPKD